jgi:hypothetical protein
MRVTAALGLVFVAALATPALGQSFAGEWVATAETPGGAASETLFVVATDDGYAITAELHGAVEGQPQGGPGTDIVVDGDSFSYNRTVSFGPDSEIVLSYTGVVSGDTFTGTATLMGTAIPYNGVRVTDRD